MQRTILLSILLSLFFSLLSCTNQYAPIERLLHEGSYQQVIESAQKQFMKQNDPKFLSYQAQALRALGEPKSALEVMKLANSLTPIDKQTNTSLSFELALSQRDWAYAIIQGTILDERGELTVEEAKGLYQALMRMGKIEEAQALFTINLFENLTPYEQAKLFITSEINARNVGSHLKDLTVEEQIALVLELVPLGLAPSTAEAWFISLRNEKTDTIELYRALALLAGRAGRRFEEVEYAELYRQSKE